MVLVVNKCRVVWEPWNSIVTEKPLGDNQTQTPVINHGRLNAVGNGLVSPCRCSPGQTAILNYAASYSDSRFLGVNSAVLLFRNEYRM